MASRTITPLPSSLRTQTSPNLSSPFMGVVNSDSIENNNLRNVLKGERVPTAEDRENLERRILSYDLINKVTMDGTLDLFLSGKIDGEMVKGVQAFFDFSGFTSYVERVTEENGERAAEDVKKKMDDLFSVIDELVVSYGGAIDKFVGDAVMVNFGAVRTHEDDPNRALSLALEVREAIMKIHDETGFSITAGLEYGRYYFGPVGTQRRFDVTSLGVAVNLAAKFEKAADKWGIYVGEKLRELADDSFVFEPVEVEIKSGEVIKKIFANRLLGRRDVESNNDSGFDYILIGRGVEGNDLSNRLLDVRENDSRLFTAVSGEAGIGKSKIIDYATGLNGLTYFNVAATEMKEGIPFAVISDLFRSSQAVLVLDDIDKIGLSDETQKFIGALLGESDIEAAIYSREILIERVSDAVAEFFNRYREIDVGNLCLILDDLHWADDQSLEVIEKLKGKLNDGIGVILSYRQRPNFSKNFEADDPIELGPLNEVYSTGLVRNILRQVGVEINEKAIEDLVRISQGNPFYLETGAKALARGEDALTSELNNLLISEVDKVGFGSRRIMEAAALLGREFDPSILRRLLGVHVDLSPLEKKRILQRLDTGYYRIDHALRVEAFRNLLTDAAESDLNMRAALAYLEEPGEKQKNIIDNIVYHFEEVERLVGGQDVIVSGLTEKKRKILLKDAYSLAVHNRLSVGAYKEASEIYEKMSGLESDLNLAFNHLVSAANLGEGYDDPDLQSYYWKLAAEKIDARVKLVVEDGSNIIDAVEGFSSEATIRSCYRFKVLTGLVEISKGNFVSAIKHLEDAKVFVSMGNVHSYEGLININLGRANSQLGFARKSVEFFENAVNYFKDYLSSGELSDALSLSCWNNLLFALANIPGREEEAEEAFRIAETIVDRNKGVSFRDNKCYNHLGYARLELARGDYDSVLKRLKYVREVASSLGKRGHINYADLTEAEICAFLGREEEAKSLFLKIIGDCEAGGDMYKLSRIARVKLNELSLK